MHFIFKAIFAGNIAYVQRVIADADVDINEIRYEAFNETPLHLAARLGKVEIVRLLLINNANIYALDKNNNTPLFSAVFNINCVTNNDRNVSGEDYCQIFDMILQHELTLRSDKIKKEQYQNETLLIHRLGRWERSLKEVINAVIKKSTQDNLLEILTRYEIEFSNKSTSEVELTPDGELRHRKAHASKETVLTAKPNLRQRREERQQDERGSFSSILDSLANFSSIFFQKSNKGPLNSLSIERTPLLSQESESVTPTAEQIKTKRYDKCL